MIKDPMIVIGITGPIGHGKTTFANALARVEPNSRHFESSAVIAEVADAWHATLKGPIDLRQADAWIQKLPDVLHAVLAIDCTYEQIKPNLDDLRASSVEYEKLLSHIAALQRDFELAHAPITSENKEAYRPILQWLGGYLVQRVDKAIWYREVVRRIQACNPKDVRLCTVGGLRFPGDADALRKINAVIIKLYRPELAQNDMLDPTERERDSIAVNSMVINEGSEDHLQAMAVQLLKDLQSNRIQQIYRP